MSWCVCRTRRPGPPLESFTVNVANTNDAPTAAHDGFIMNENTTLTIAAGGVLGNDSDVDGDPLAAVLVSGPDTRHADAQRRRLVHVHAGLRITTAATHSRMRQRRHRDSNVATVSFDRQRG